MEEQALYRAILSTPHDDTARLVYADWLDENAERFPDMLARSERARAEFIRMQCALARLGPGGWNTGGPSDPELVARQKRLHFRCGGKWRRALPIPVRTAPFDRGFLRPFRALCPQEFLGRPLAPYRGIPVLWPLPSDSPALRYIPDGDPFDVCPLWDVHLYATDYDNNDERNDHGQYGDLLAEVGRSPSLERVGWLKVSFFVTPVFEFLRTGNFANVETLVLNSRPFPHVLEAVAENESFRSLRYILFGGDWWAWSGTGPMSDRDIALLSKITDANARHLPHGEMRTALRDILGGLPPRPPAVPLPLRMPEWAHLPAPVVPETYAVPAPFLTHPVEQRVVGATALIVGLCVIVFVGVILLGRSSSRSVPTPQFNSGAAPHTIPPEGYDLERQNKWGTTAPTRRFAPPIVPRTEKKE